jgi:hypothetical protein
MSEIQLIQALHAGSSRCPGASLPPVCRQSALQSEPLALNSWIKESGLALYNITSIGETAVPCWRSAVHNISL